MDGNEIIGKFMDDPEVREAIKKRILEQIPTMDFTKHMDDAIGQMLQEELDESAQSIVSDFGDALIETVKTALKDRFNL